MDYTKKGDEELDLKKDDILKVFKRYNHWSYVSPCLSDVENCLFNVQYPGCQRRRRCQRLGSGKQISCTT